MQTKSDHESVVNEVGYVKEKNNSI